ncbi:hypothetical protein [Pseudomonas phage Misse]|uniref:Uncharacterized protein n=1 Tax=Pseudomonas phage Bertil TaxID=2801385 RepID=A0A7T8IWP5_9CAUD|nr:hypothetical protein [Pseudomonas phage Bertil]QQO90865.1 hypothetical protein [Pseudomonas phage Misse]QQO90916.1 hypothetical protein [Pseudomonas phage Strit]
MEYNPMAIESATPAVQIELRRRAVIAAAALQTFANSTAVRTAAQAAPIDAALAALQTALVAAGAGPVLPTTQKTLTSGTKTPVGTVTGTGTFGTPTIVNGVITGIVLSAS